MKTFKRFSAILLAVLMMVAMMAVPASAANDYTVTIESDADVHEYVIYQIFIGDLSGAVLSNIKWGSNVTSDGRSHFGDAQAYAGTLKETAHAQTFAEALVAGSYLTNGTPIAEYADGKYSIDGLAAGYYLIKDEANLEGTYHAYTDYILRVVSNVDVKPKSSVPTLETRVSRSGETAGYAEAVSASIGKDVWFELKGSMPNLIADFDTYTMIFNDTIPNWLTPAEEWTATTPSFNNVKVWVVNNNAETNYTQIASGYEVKYVDGTLTVTVPDVKTAIKAATGVDALTQDNIVVTFSATVNNKVKIGADGNTSSATMSFSNDPNNLDKMGTTPRDTAKVYSYELDLLKQGNTTEKPSLSGAQFVVYRYKNASEKEYLAVDTDGNVTIPDNPSREAAIQDPFITGTDGMIRIKGVSSGTYYFEEIKAPEGYNKPSAEFGIMITAKLKDGEGADELGTFKADIVDTTGMSSASAVLSSGVATITVLNNAGATLPTTGGIGTTIFYGIGGVLVLGALALLTVRKRTTAK